MESSRINLNVNYFNRFLTHLDILKGRLNLIFVDNENFSLNDWHISPDRVSLEL